MKNEKQSKLIVILALCVSVIGLAIGFAAFSNTLTISSSATVAPDASDFKIKAYGLVDPYPSINVNNIKLYSSDKISDPIFYDRGIDDDNIPSASVASISDNGSHVHISNIAANFTGHRQQVDYYFAIKNEGEYDAYLDLKNIEWPNFVCVARPGTSQNLVDKACSQSTFYFALYDTGMLNISDYYDEYYLLSKGSYIILNTKFIYGSTLPDGDFDVKVSDFILDFSSVKPE